MNILETQSSAYVLMEMEIMKAIRTLSKLVCLLSLLSTGGFTSLFHIQKNSRL